MHTSDTIEADNTPAAPLLLYPKMAPRSQGTNCIRWKAIVDAEYYLLAIGESVIGLRNRSEYALSVTLSKGIRSLKLKAVDKATIILVTEIITITKLTQQRSA